MTNIFVISNEKYNLEEYSLKTANGFYEALYDDILNFESDIVILDSSIENSASILIELLAKNTNKTFEIFYITETYNKDEIKTPVKTFLKPVNSEILKNEINLAVLNKQNFINLYKENMELKKNLYQIDAFYNASSKFAGTLEKEKLYEVAFESLERILSYDTATALFWDNLKEDKLKFYINSLKKTTEEFNSNLIKRLSLGAKDVGITSLKLSRFEVETIQNVKPSYKNEYFDDSFNEYDSLIAPIVIKDKFEGVIEIFRKNKFTKEDVTCFQSIIHQILAPLRSAILYEDIINANIQLKKLERMKSEFVSIVSHELRTPLTPINNALSIILSEQGGAIGDVNKNFANIAKRNVSRLSGIIEDLLDLSRMQTGKFDFKFTKASLLPSIELAYNTFKNQAAQKNIEFNLENNVNLPDVYIDQHRIDQIISNLITNAIKFTPDGGKIRISTGIIENPDKSLLITPSDGEYSGAYVKISVQDTGVGIEKEDIPKIFDKFSQIENTLSRNTGGIGLGLTITKHFIDAHLGGIWVDSVKNEGSTFNFIIPAYSDEKAFRAELNLKIRNEAESTGYLKIIENSDFEFYNHLKNSNIIKLTKTSKEFLERKNDKYVTQVYMQGLDRSAFDFMVSKIEDEINLKSCDIVLSKAFYKKDAWILPFIVRKWFMQKKILVVDDEKDITETLSFMLKATGYDVLTANDGEEGLKCAKEENPDLIILDVMMPKINGYKIARLLKYDNKYKHIPIVMVTARGQDSDKLIGEETGANEYITKPFEFEEVLKSVRKYLEA